ncbi:hypothetical protein [Accumulibacter sp.]|uniref:hypothetical protein n=1 Tax=Accumulibacter sp. TaxID=2053492 RepID=UPI00159B4A3F|nr:MAG: hypothetical protein HT579_17115 [Candidatus Accumulibacter similis]
MKKLLLMIDQPPTKAARPTSNNSKHSSNPRHAKPPAPATNSTSTSAALPIASRSDQSAGPAGRRPSLGPGAPAPLARKIAMPSADDFAACARQRQTAFAKLPRMAKAATGTPPAEPIYDSKASPRDAGEIAIFCFRASTPEIDEQERNTVQ